MESNLTIFDALWSIFMGLWFILDLFFTWIDEQFRLVFNAIPYTAIAFLIGIFCYSIVAFFYWAIDKAGNTRKRLYLKIFYAIYSIIMVLFSIWRLGFMAMIDNKINVVTIGEFLFNLVYIIFGVILIVSFLKKIDWLKKAIIGFLWAMLSLFTWVIGPIIGEITLSQETLQQFLILAIIFLIPNFMYEYRKQKRKSI